MKRFLKAVMHYALADLSVILVQLVLFLWIFRIRSPESFGAIAIATSAHFWLLPLVRLGMDASAPRFLSKYPTQRLELLASFVRLRLVIATFASIGLAIVASTTQPLVCWTMMAIIPLLWAEALQLDFVCIGLEASTVLRHARWLSCLIPIPLVLISSYLQWHPAIIFVAQLMGTSASVSYLWYRLGLRPFHLRLPAPMSTRSIIHDVFNTTMAQFCIAGCGVIDLFLLGLLQVVDLPQLGEYRVGNRLVQLGAIPLLAASRSVSADLAIAYTQVNGGQISSLERLFKRFTWIGGLIIALCLAFIAPHIMSWLVQRPLALLHQISPWLGLVFFAWAWHNPYSSIFPLRGLNQSYMVINIIGLVVGGVAGVTLIWTCGITGAPVAMAMAYIVMGILGRRRLQLPSQLTVGSHVA